MNSDHRFAGGGEGEEGSGTIIRTIAKWLSFTANEYRLFGIAVGALGALSAVLALMQVYVHDETKALEFSFLLIIAVPSLYIVLRRTIKRKVLLRVPVMVSSLVVAMLLGTAVGDAFGSRMHFFAESQSGASGASLRVSGINFLQPHNGEHVKECPIVDGSGTIPADKELYIFSVPPGTNGLPKQYWPESPTRMDGPDHWSASEPVSVGLPSLHGLKGEIYGVLLDKKWAKFISTSAEGVYWPTLPPTATVIGPVTVTRIADPDGLSCHS